ncbi:flippase-like domain-containing protein [Candidatus Dojkabacteria bacterium]|jgi:uncharacterized membrane protein YbhN (UPF0104 family)|nr:flippase-like domain-containing protein [Candidatus Dojkabacteria bacterium]
MKKAKKLIKNLISWVVIIFFCYLIYRNIGDFKTLSDTISDADFVFMTWGLLLGIGNLAIMTIIFKSNYSIFANKDEPIGPIFPEMIAFSFFMISNPLGVSAANAFFVRKLAKKGFSFVQSMFSMFSVQLSIQTAFLPILGVALLILKNSDKLNQYTIYGSGAMLLLNVIIVVIMALLLILPHFSLGVARVIGKFINSISKPLFKVKVINTKKIEDGIIMVQDVSGTFDHSAKKYATTIFFSFIYHVINVVILYFAFITFNVQIPISSLVTLYGIIFLFSTVAPTPQGIGIVESLAQIAAISIGIPNGAATVAILLYRVMTLWAPALFGLFLFKFKKEVPSVPSLAQTN